MRDGRKNREDKTIHRKADTDKQRHVEGRYGREGGEVRARQKPRPQYEYKIKGT